MMKRGAIGVLWVGLVLTVGCGSGFQLGLSNAPGANHRSRPRAPHDVVANGPESCNEATSTSADPLRHRIPPCQGEERRPSAPQLLAHP